MGKNSKSSTPNTPFCEKLLKAFGMSHRPKINKLSSSISHHEHHHHQQQRNSSQHIYVHHEPAVMEKTHSSKNNKYAGGDEDSVNAAFSNYINRAKRRLENMASKKHSNDSSSRGKENNLKAEDRRFSDYIVRARNKLRSTSSSVGLAKTKSSSSVK
ncbi:hypothetical protein Csa_004306 [Cucumis sativus]|uniref:Uncharacterized protein n=1 Tax=Cucumis sativus TaxID=3659 RepID=A0A0A0KG94_CUCSA|nr:hypothetical protein Csa_004306 [Cucumis sativus]